MSRIKGFFSGLSKSTKITLISCGCFVLLTLLILTFFVIFPITPSERAISNLGREGLVYNDGEDAPVTTAVTTANDVSTTTAARTTPAEHSEVRITFTTVSGFLSGGYIQTGEFGVNNVETVTTPAEPGDEPNEEESQPSEESGNEPVEEPTEPMTDIPDAPVQIVTTPAQEPTRPQEIPTSPAVVVPTDPPTEAPPAPTDAPQADDSSGEDLQQ